MRRYKVYKIGWCECKAQHGVVADKKGEYANADDLQRAIVLLKDVINAYPPEGHQTKAQRKNIDRVRGYFGSIEK